MIGPFINDQQRFYFNRKIYLIQWNGSYSIEHEAATVEKLLGVKHV
jgi:hypothetical protein